MEKDKTARACRRSIFLFPFINFFYWAAIYLYTPTLSAYLAGRGAAAQTLGLVVGGYGLTQILFRLPFGVCSDRLRRRKPFVCAGMLLSGLSALTAALFPTSAGFFAARCLTGVAASAWVNCTVLFPRYFEPARMDEAVSRLNAYSAIGTALSVFAGGVIVQRLGQVAACYVAAACGAAALILSLCIAEVRPEARRPLTRADVAAILRDKNLWRFSLVAMTFHFVWAGANSCFTPLVAQGFGVTSVQLGVLSAAGTLGIFLASAVTGVWLLPRLSTRKIILGGFCLLALCLVLTVYVRRYGLLLAVQTLQGFAGYCAFLCALLHCMKEKPDEQRGIAIGLTQALYAGGMFLGPLVMGQLVGRISLTNAYFCAAALCAAMALLSMRWTRDL